MSLTWLFIGAYIGIFGWCAYRSGQFKALYAGLGAWLLYALVGAYLLPGIGGMAASLYQPYLYLSVACVVLCGQNWQWHGEQQAFTVSDSVPPLLHYWAAAALTQHAAYLILLVLSWLYYPHGTSAFALLSLIQLYWLQPIWWIAVQAVLMLLLFLNRTHHTAPSLLIRAQDLQALFLSALVMMALYVVHDLWRFVNG